MKYQNLDTFHRPNLKCKKKYYYSHNMTKGRCLTTYTGVLGGDGGGGAGVAGGAGGAGGAGAGGGGSAGADVAL